MEIGATINFHHAYFDNVILKPILPVDTQVAGIENKIWDKRG